MASISITVNDVSVDLAQKIVSLVHGSSVIAPEDRPDTGKDVSPPAAPATPTVSAPASVPAGNPFAPAASASVSLPPSPPVLAAVPAAPSAASGTAPAASAVPASGVEVDSRGLPWDPRIHASTKSKTQKGVWTAKRGINDEAMVHRIEEELRAAMAARAPASTPGTVVAPPPPPLVTAAGAAVGLPISPAADPSSAAVPVAPAAALPSTASLNAANSQPAAPSAPTPPAPSSGETFGQLMARLAPLLHTDPAKAAKINEALAAFSLTALAGLATRPDLVPAFSQTVDAMLATA